MIISKKLILLKIRKLIINKNYCVLKLYTPEEELFPLLSIAMTFQE
jgi:hypothetical protein